MSEKRKRLRWSEAWQEARVIIWQRRRRLGIGLVLIVFGRLAGLVPPLSIKFLVDDVIGEGRRELLMPLALIAGTAAVVQAGSSFLLSQLLGVAAQKSVNEMRIRVQQHIGRLPIGFFDSAKSGTLISRVMTDSEGIRNLVGTGLVQLIGGLLTAAIGMVVLFYLNWRLTLFMIVVLAAFGVVLAYAFKRLRPLFRERGKLTADVTGRLAETFGGIRIVKAYTAEKREDLAFARGAHKIFRNVAKSITGVSSVTALTTLLFGLSGVLMMVVGAGAILDGTMTAGEFSTYVAFIIIVAAPMAQITNIGTQITEAFAGLDRIREIMRLRTEDDEDERRSPVGEIDGTIEFKEVFFRYDGGEPVLKGISFRAPAGTTTALVGSSGSGKSTLISLVMAFNRPQEGRIELDGRDLDGLRLREYRARLGVVMQDNFLFDGTVAENVAYSRPRAPREEIERVGRIAHCDEFVRKFEHGYDTVVGERGVKVSGGQRQRIGIARAILADPKILILDEATSSLDSESEALIQDGLTVLRRGRTTFVIAHRLSTIQSADQILVVEDGRIVERGKHDELLALNGRYKELYDKQYKIERDRFINPGEDFTPEPKK